MSANFPEKFVWAPTPSDKWYVWFVAGDAFNSDTIDFVINNPTKEQFDDVMTWAKQQPGVETVQVRRAATTNVKYCGIYTDSDDYDYKFVSNHGGFTFELGIRIEGENLEGVAIQAKLSFDTKSK